MKKISKVVLALASIFALVGCGESSGGKNETIDNATATKRLQTVTEEMGKAAGFKVEGNESLSLSINQADYKDEENKDVKGTSLNLSSTGTFGLELLLEEAMPKAGKATASVAMDVSGTAANGHAEVSAEGYLKDGMLYGKYNSSVDQGGDAPSTDEGKSGVAAEAILGDLIGTIEGMKDKSVEEIIRSFVDIDIEEGVIDSYVNAAFTKLPTCNLTTNKKTETFSWKLTNADIDNMIDAAIMGQLPTLEESGLSQEKYDELVKETTNNATTIKALVSNILKINNAEVAISVYDAKYISGVKLDLDVEVAVPASLGVFPADTVFKLKSNLSGSISLLDANYTINYPADLESWLPTPETDQ